LLNKNFEILERNFRTPYGEVDLVAAKNKTLWLFEIKRRKEKSLKVHPPLSFAQKERLARAMMWIWQNQRKSYDHFQSRLVIVTERGIKWITLPLLYDHS
jgi:putative endonuclease